ncbi:MAG: 3-phosphoshikimate 1-carboxyvinyltransferase [Candidatus Nanopelagicales bacterium]
MDSPESATTPAASEQSWWPAPHASGPVTGRIQVPGSKSMTNRALILGSLSEVPTEIVNPLESRDSTLMIESLRALGTQVEANDSGQLLVMRDQVPIDASTPRTIHVGLAGTVMRFIPPRAALSSGEINFDGDAQAYVRPMGPLLDAMASIGIQVTPVGADSLPFGIRANGSVRGGEVAMDASTSSQLISGLILSAASFDNGILIQHIGDSLPSMPHLQMTIEMLADAGVAASVGANTQGKPNFSVEPGELRQERVVVEPDLSNAAAFLAAAMVAGGSVKVPHWPDQTTQPGDQIRKVFENMGGTNELNGGVLTVTGPDQLVGIDVELSAIGELTPTIAAVAAVAADRGERSLLRGIGHLRGHETDRVTALATELRRAGLNVTESEDSLEILPGNLKAADFETYHDHRMATFAAIIGLVVPGCRVQNIATTAKTLPTFPEIWTTLVGQ